MGNHRYRSGMFGVGDFRKWVRKMSVLGPVIGLLATGSQSWAAQPVAAYFNGVFPTKSPGSALGWATQDAFPNLTFVDPMWLTEIPGTSELLIVGKSGRISRFPNHPGTAAAQVTTVMDLNSQLQISEDQGLYQLIFHPQFGQAGSSHANDVFVCYSHRPLETNSPDRSMWRVSKFTWSTATGTIDPASESVLIQQYDPHRWHNGGAMCFDNEGFLMITCGDGGGADDQYAQSQKINGGFFGGVLRIDVDNDPAKSHAISRQPLSHATKPSTFPASFSQGYGIPNTNPWVGGGVLEEFYAIGLRSPHTAHYDRVTGDLWVGDVGQAQTEELNCVKKGANLQWAYMEGTGSGPKTKPSGATLIGTDTAPFYSYSHSIGSCIIGGPRYRGAKWAADLGGEILFGDNMRATLSTAEVNVTPGAAPIVTRIYAGFGGSLYTGITNICTDTSGEVYFLKLNGQNAPGGKILKLVPSALSGDAPALLSATGLFKNTSMLEPSAALVAYDVASPLWSDGAVKKRWIALPNDGIHDTTSEQITFSEKGNWSFPDGTVFVKHFEIPIDGRNPTLVRRLETRVMVCTANGGKYGLTYKWNAAGTDATLLASGADETFAVTRQDGTAESRTWSYPSRADCMQCHTEATGQSIGLRTHQINRTVINPATGVPTNQLMLFDTRQWLPSGLTENLRLNYLEARSLDDATAPLEHRVRSYLDANCAHCHQPGSTAPYFDARLQTPLRSQNLVNGLIEGQFTLGPDGRYIAPGNPALSAVHVRATSTMPGVAMPPWGKHLADQQALAVLHSYITGLGAPEFVTEPATKARYVRLTATSSYSGTAISVGEISMLDGKGNAIPNSALSVKSFTSEDSANKAVKAIDGDPATLWVSTTGSFPKQITLDLGSLREIGGFICSPRQDSSYGRIRNYEAHYSENGSDWNLMASGTMNGSNSAFRFDGFINKRPARCEIAGPVAPVTSQFKVTIAFDTAVTDFTAADITIDKGKVVSLSGSGYYYTATLLAYDSTATVSVAQNVANTAVSGNRASNVLVIQNNGETSPVPVFSEIPEQVAGAFEMVVTFDRPVQWLDELRFIVTNGSPQYLYLSGTNQYRLTVVPSGTGDVVVRLPAGSVSGANNLPTTAEITATIPFAIPKLAVEAEDGTVTGGFTTAMDPSASGGSYLWVPTGSRDGNGTLDPALKTTFIVNVPHNGDYQIKGWVKSDDAAGSSFYLGVAGQGVPLPWSISSGDGETASGKFSPYLVTADGTPRVFTLGAGEHVLELYAGGDGTSIDRLELLPMRPFATWLGNGNQSDLPLDAVLEFSSDVNGLQPDDFNIGYGTVTRVTGSGRRYTIATSTAYPTTISLKQGAVQNSQGLTNPDSPAIYLNWNNTYEQWAEDHHVDSSEASDSLDADGDGLGQLMEYAFGLDPAIPDRQVFNPADADPKGLPIVSYTYAGDGLHNLWISFLTRFGGLPLTYTVEYTSDFIHYDSQSSFSFQEPTLSPQWGRIDAYDFNGTGRETKRFVRLKVER